MDGFAYQLIKNNVSCDITLYNFQMDSQSCPICFLEYNEKQRAPYDVCKEGHTICLLCLNDIKKAQHPPSCPICRNPIDAHINRFAINLILQARKKKAAAGHNAVWPEPQKKSEKKLQPEKQAMDSSSMNLNQAALGVQKKANKDDRYKAPPNIPPIVNPPRRLKLDNVEQGSISHIRQVVPATTSNRNLEDEDDENNCCFCRCYCKKPKCLANCPKCPKCGQCCPPCPACPQCPSCPSCPSCPDPSCDCDCCDCSSFSFREFCAVMSFLVVVVYHWSVEAVTWQYMLTIQYYFILGFLNFMFCQLHILYLYINGGSYQRKDMLAHQLLFWRWDVKLEGQLSVYNIMKYFIYGFSLVGVAVTTQTWSPLSIAAVSLNFLGFFEIITVRLLVKDLRDAVVSIISDVKPLRYITMGILVLYCYAEPILQIVFLMNISPVYLIFHYCFIYFLLWLMIIRSQNMSDGLKMLGASIGGYPFVVTIAGALRKEKEDCFNNFSFSMLVFVKCVVSPIIMLAYSLISFDQSNYTLGVISLILTMYCPLQVSVSDLIMS